MGDSKWLSWKTRNLLTEIKDIKTKLVPDNSEIHPEVAQLLTYLNSISVKLIKCEADYDKKTSGLFGLRWVGSWTVLTDGGKARDKLDKKIDKYTEKLTEFKAHVMESHNIEKIRNIIEVFSDASDAFDRELDVIHQAIIGKYPTKDEIIESLFKKDTTPDQVSSFVEVPLETLHEDLDAMEAKRDNGTSSTTRPGVK